MAFKIDGEDAKHCETIMVVKVRGDSDGNGQ